MMQDIRAELHFYGKQYDRLGVIYLTTRQIPMPHPDVLFFCLVTLRLMTDKKFSTAGVARMRQKLAVGSEWEKVFTRDAQRPFDPLMELCEYSTLTKRVIRTQLLFKGSDKYAFMLGHSGFGFWQNKRPFDRCAEGAVYGLLEKIYTLKKQPEETALLWKAAQALSQAAFTVAGKGGYKDLAEKIYRDVVAG